MTLTRKLDHVQMILPCSACGHELRKPGRWFLVVPRYRCEGCGMEQRITYDDRAQLQRRYRDRII